MLPVDLSIYLVIPYSLHIKTIGALNPRCVFWDEVQGKWSTEGVSTRTQVTLEDREFKAYRLVCLSRHLSSFAVIADVEARVSSLSLKISLSLSFKLFSLSLLFSSLSLLFSSLSLSPSLPPSLSPHLNNYY